MSLWLIHRSCIRESHRQKGALASDKNGREFEINNKLAVGNLNKSIPEYIRYFSYVVPFTVVV